jgi:hypothetical protein
MTQEKTQSEIIAENVIVAFHIGRGGHFYNSGHLSYIGEQKIGDFTSELFISYENQSDILRKIGKRKNLISRFEKCLDADDFGFFEKLGFDLGEKIYTDSNGRSVGLSLEEEESGIGRINIDFDYNTTYTCLLSDCDENELQVIQETTGYRGYNVERFLNALKEEEEETED